MGLHWVWGSRATELQNWVILYAPYLWGSLGWEQHPLRRESVVGDQQNKSRFAGLNEACWEGGHEGGWGMGIPHYAHKVSAF